MARLFGSLSTSGFDATYVAFSLPAADKPSDYFS